MPLISEHSVQPRHDYILIRRQLGGKTSGGIELPKQKVTSHGTVVRVGPGLFDWEKKEWAEVPDLERGDYVLFVDHEQDPERLELDEMVLIRSTSIVAVIEERG